MPLPTLQGWIAYYELEPFGEFRADVRAAIIAHTTYQMMRGKGSREMSLQDFMPKLGTRPRQSVPIMIANAKLITAALGGTVSKR